MWHTFLMTELAHLSPQWERWYMFHVWSLRCGRCCWFEGYRHTGLALIRTSVQLLRHFRSGCSLDGLFIFIYFFLKKGPLLHCNALFTTQVSVWPQVTSAHEDGSSIRKPAPTHGSETARNEGCCANRCSGIMSFLIFWLLFGPNFYPVWIKLFSVYSSETTF